MNVRYRESSIQIVVDSWGSEKIDRVYLEKFENAEVRPVFFKCKNGRDVVIGLDIVSKKC